MKGLGGPLRVAVGGGKGGVGKSVVAANLACAMADLGFRTILVDADLGSANQHTLFGIDRPGLTLQALVDRKIDTLEQAVTATKYGRLFLVPGSGAVVGAANVAHAQKLKLIRHIAKLDADAIVIDCGAGTSYNVVDLFAAADVKLLVASPQLTSLQNAYAFVKSAVYRSMMARAINPARKDLLATATDRSETERVRGLVDRVATDDWTFADELARVVDTFEAKVVGNQLDTPKQEGVLHAFSRMMTDFLALEAPVTTSLPFSGAIHTDPSPPVLRSSSSGRPLWKAARWSHSRKNILELGRSLASRNPQLGTTGTATRNSTRRTAAVARPALPLPPTPTSAFR